MMMDYQTLCFESLGGTKTSMELNKIEDMYIYTEKKNLCRDKTEF